MANKERSPSLGVLVKDSTTWLSLGTKKTTLSNSWVGNQWISIRILKFRLTHPSNQNFDLRCHQRLNGTHHAQQDASQGRSKISSLAAKLVSGFNLWLSGFNRTLYDNVLNGSPGVHNLVQIIASGWMFHKERNREGRLCCELLSRRDKAWSGQECVWYVGWRAWDKKANSTNESDSCLSTRRKGATPHVEYCPSPTSWWKILVETLKGKKEKVWSRNAPFPLWIDTNLYRGSLTSPMVSVLEPQLRTTANSKRIATKIAIKEDGITLKICNGYLRGTRWLRWLRWSNAEKRLSKKIFHSNTMLNHNV